MILEWWVWLIFIVMHIFRWYTWRNGLGILKNGGYSDPNIISLRMWMRGWLMCVINAQTTIKIILFLFEKHVLLQAAHHIRITSTIVDAMYFLFIVLSHWMKMILHMKHIYLIYRWTISGEDIFCHGPYYNIGPCDLSNKVSCWF